MGLGFRVSRAIAVWGFGFDWVVIIWPRNYIVVAMVDISELWSLTSSIFDHVAYLSVCGGSY